MKKIYSKESSEEYKMIRKWHQWQKESKIRNDLKQKKPISKNLNKQKNKLMSYIKRYSIKTKPSRIIQTRNTEDNLQLK